MKAVLNVVCTTRPLEDERESSFSQIGVWLKDGVIGDIEDKSMTPKDFLLKCLDKDEDCEDSIMELENELSSKYYWLPIFGYNHSGYSFSTTPFSDKWDSGRAGIIIIPKDVAAKVPEITSDDEAREYLKKEVEAFNNHYQGLKAYEWFVQIGDSKSYVCSDYKTYHAFDMREAVEDIKKAAPKGIRKIFDNISIEDTDDELLSVTKKVRLVKR